MFTDIQEELANDPWFKVVEFLQQNWAVVIRRESDVLVVFFDDCSGVFDEMTFSSYDDAEKALIRNGFNKFLEDQSAQEFIDLPRGEFYEQHIRTGEFIQVAGSGTEVHEQGANLNRCL